MYQDVKTPKHLDSEVDLLTTQLEQLTEEMVKLRRERRADYDRFTLELESIKQFLAEAHPELQSRFEELREEIRLEVNPE